MNSALLTVDGGGCWGSRLMTVFGCRRIRTRRSARVPLRGVANSCRDDVLG